MNKIQISSLNHPALRKHNNENVYYVIFIKDGKLREERCSEELYAKIVSQKLAYNFKLNITLCYNKDNTLIDRIDVFPKEDNFFELDQPNQDNDINSINNIIFGVYPDGSVSVKLQPKNIKREVVEEILDYLHLHHMDVVAQDFILDKYLVADVRQNGQYIHIDPTVR